MGLTLLAELSRIRNVISPFGDQIRDAGGSVKKALEKEPPPVSAPAEDLGEVIQRSNIVDGIVDNLAACGKETFDLDSSFVEPQIPRLDISDTKATHNGPSAKSSEAGFMKRALKITGDPSAVGVSKKHKKQKKHVNPIDDLFEGL